MPDDASPRLKVAPLEVSLGLRRQACEAIKRAITEMDIYGHPGEIRLDERQLSQDLGVSRTPIREALSVLEQEGFVRTVPRRGVVVVRKSKREIVEMITVWAALESFAARLAAPRISAAEVAALRALVDAFEDDPSAHLSEYSNANMQFHKAIIRLGGVALMASLTENLFIHMRAVRAVTMTQDNRAQRSVVDHRNIIAALAAHDADLAERLVREHTLGLAAHVEKSLILAHEVGDRHAAGLDPVVETRSVEGEGRSARSDRAVRPSPGELRSPTSPASGRGVLRRE